MAKGSGGTGGGGRGGAERGSSADIGTTQGLSGSRLDRKRKEIATKYRDTIAEYRRTSNQALIPAIANYSETLKELGVYHDKGSASFRFNQSGNVGTIIHISSILP